MKHVTYKAIVSAMIVLVAAVGERALAAEALPEPLRGFSGQVRGVVLKKGEKNVFFFKVGRVLRVWKNNEAASPESLVGRTVPVGPRWIKGDNGKWHPVELHVAFIRKLEAGQEVTLEIRNVERNHFAILELSAEQRKWARSGDGIERNEKGERAGDKGKTEALIRQLKEEIRRLKAENAQLRRKLEQAEGPAK